MLNLLRERFERVSAGAASLTLVAAWIAISLCAWEGVLAQPPEPEPAPPADQQYLGPKQCASCHFDQYMTWKQTKHPNVFELLPAKHQSDANCLQCHATGYGEPTGFKDKASTPVLAGVTCEKCHGPGSKHAEIAKPFAQLKQLTPEQEKTVRDSIWRLQPQNVCAKCHITKAHQESPTPPELRKKS